MELILITPDDERIPLPMWVVPNPLPRKGEGIVYNNNAYEVKEVIFDYDDEEIRIIT